MTTLEARLDKDQVREVYRGLAPIYDFWADITEVRARSRALELAAVRDGEAILEVAVGTGLAFIELVRQNPSGTTTGLDLTPAMLAKAESRMARAGLPGRYELSIGDATELPFPDASFDLVLNNYMFDLLPEADFGTVLAEFHRVLRPGGRMVLVNMAQGEAWQHQLYDRLYQLSPRLVGGCRGVAMEASVAAAGFGNVQRELSVQVGLPSEVILALRGDSRV
jgi:ubiquinone/menaquinone biosynthesis C-methylase UbiE